jgi:hypothetical protein
MRVPLAAVPEHGDVPLLYKPQVGAVVVDDLSHFRFSSFF